MLHDIVAEDKAQHDGGLDDWLFPTARGGRRDKDNINKRCSNRSCDRCSAPLPSPDDPVYDDWTFIPGQHGSPDEVVCPPCIRLAELAERIGWERQHGYL